MKKAIFTLNIDNYFSDMCSLTYPLMEKYAKKIGAEFRIITERKFPSFPIPYEKLQLYKIGRGYDWVFFLDSDALVNPNTFDPTEHLTKDTVMHMWSDMAGIRFNYDRFFRRDGRHIGSGNWFTVASDWCIDLWKPLDDLTLEEAVANIHPTVFERQAGVEASHLIDDYVLSRNIAKYGLKFMPFTVMMQKLGSMDEYFWHNYLMSAGEKVDQARLALKRWGLSVP